jgi:RNA polymerase sigma-70 factor (ECF subfamily)
MKQMRPPAHQNFEDATFGYLGQLFRLAYARVGNQQDAEDIVQDTYLKAYRAFQELRQPEQIKSWLTQILINTINDYMRKGLRRLPTIDLEELSEDAAQQFNQIGPEEQLCLEEIDPLLMQALHSLPEIFLTPLLLREVYDANYEEISQILNVPKGTVMSRLSRARALLRKSMLTNVLNKATISGVNNENQACEVRKDEVR